MGDSPQKEQLNRELDEVRSAWRATPRDLFTSGRDVQHWLSDSPFLTALGYPTAQRLIVAELAGFDVEALMRAALFWRLVTKGGYARPTNDADLELAVPGSEGAEPAWRRFVDCSRDELERAVPYAITHGKPPQKKKAPPPPPPPPTPTPSPLVTPGRVLVGLAVVAAIAFIVRINSAPTQSAPPDWTPPVLPPSAQATQPLPAPPAASAPVHRNHPAARVEPLAAPVPIDAGAAVVPDPLGGKEKDLTPEQLERILEKERREQHPPIIE
jgi:hypothetical protein